MHDVALVLRRQEEVLLDEPLRHHELDRVLALAVGRRVATALAAVAAGARLGSRCRVGEIFTNGGTLPDDCPSCVPTPSIEELVNLGIVAASVVALNPTASTPAASSAAAVGASAGATGARGLGEETDGAEAMLALMRGA